MRKLIQILLAFALFNSTLTAKPIDINTAKVVGQNFLKTSTNSPLLSKSINLDLAFISQSKSSNPSAKTNPLNYFYVFNVNQSAGFVIVSADDIVLPVLAYSDEKPFDADNIPTNVAKWLEGYKQQIIYAISKNVQANTEISSQWSELISGNVNSIRNKKAGVNPLIQTKWNQSPYYNELCPYDTEAGERTVTGCVATAMAQVMKYWNYPATGSGFHQYNHSKFGTLSTNFGSSTYNWSAMTNTVNSSNPAVARLMFDCGVSVDMNYGIGRTGGSGSAGAVLVAPALKQYFNYPSSVTVYERNNYSTPQWIQLLKTELNASRPMYYEGIGNGSGHAFVCDGYDNNDFFHFNWGWAGNSDGYYNINALNPIDLGTGAGNGSYNSNQKIVAGIQSPTGAQTYNLNIADDVTASSTNINYGAPFSITTNIENKGNNTFYGTYAACLFASDGSFVGIIDSIQETTGLPSNYRYTNNLVFSNSGNFTYLPGLYRVYMFYKPQVGNWIQLKASGMFTSDYTDINIKYANTIELNSNITSTPSSIIQGQGVSVNLNVINAGTPTFFGQYALNLYNLDGSFAETIGVVNENNGLPSGYTYQSPFITFSKAQITSAPGTYLLAVQFKANTASNWTLVGSTNFQNPVKINVIAPPYLKDQYEDNNTQVTAYSLPITFSANTAKGITTGSNCHIGTDYDFYKIVLPVGFNYVINPRLQDEYSANNGGQYTLDALFSYSTDGITWSEAYDNVLAAPIEVPGGRTVYFKVSPYFSGQTGTYLLDINLTRESNTGLKEAELADFINVYPNPASDLIHVDIDKGLNKIDVVQLSDIQGKLVFEQSNIDTGSIEINTASLGNGFYFVAVKTSSGTITKKVVIAK